VYSGVWPLSYLYIFPLCFVSTGLLCKACSLGLVHFTGETLSVSFQKFCSSDGPDLLWLRVGGSSHNLSDHVTILSVVGCVGYLYWCVIHVYVPMN